MFSLASVISPGATITAGVDLTAAAPLAHYWKRCVGSGHMLLGTRADWRAHLKLAVDELGFTGIRGHGLLDDDMSVTPNGRDFEFYNVDQVFDYLLSIKVRPVVELSFMPSALVSCGGDKQPKCSYAFGDAGGYKGLIMPPDDFGAWTKLVGALGAHLVDRYGEEEVAAWHFEVWNEMWGVSFPQPYMQLYNASAAALKGVSPRLRVGGPATMQTLDVGEFIDACDHGGIPMDFVSTHFYPTDPQCQSGTARDDPDCFATKVLAAQRLAAKAKVPFFITECGTRSNLPHRVVHRGAMRGRRYRYNNGLGHTSRDDASAAAFVFRHVGPSPDPNHALVGIGIGASCT